MAEPYPKTRQLARGERRYRRKVASPKQWAALRAEKLDGQPCRLLVRADGHERLCDGTLQLHHLVARAQGGDDVAENLAPLCDLHHGLVTRYVPPALEALAESLTIAEQAYIAGKLGAGGMQRLFGV